MIVLSITKKLRDFRILILSVSEVWVLLLLQIEVLFFRLMSYVKKFSLIK